MSPSLSVIIPAFNAQSSLEEAVASVQAQAFPDWELVIVDDGSTDATLELAEQCASRDERIRVVRQENRGSGGAYNTGIRFAKTDWLVMLSADDRLLPEHLSFISNAIISEPQAAVVTCGGWYEYENGYRELAEPEAHWADPTQCVLEELLESCFYGVGAAFSREVFDAVGGFREQAYAEDYLFWLLALAHGFRHHHIRRPLSVHRRNVLQKSADAVRMRETDLQAVTEVMQSGLLSPREYAVARRTVRRLRLVILARRHLSRAVDPQLAGGLIATVRALMRSRRSRSRSATTHTGVAFVNNFPGPTLGGGEVQLLTLVRGITAAGMSVKVACASGSALETEVRQLRGVCVVPVDFSLWRLPAVLAKLPSCLVGADVIQGTGLLANAIARFVGGSLRIPVVNTVHVVPGAARADGDSRTRLLLRVGAEQLLQSRVTRFVAVSEAVRRGLLARGLPAERIRVITNGLDIDSLRLASKQAPPALAPASAYVGVASRLERVKGVEYFIRAAARLNRDYPHVRFIIAGAGSEEVRLQRLATELGLTESVQFLGYVASSPPVIAALDVLVVPSLSEASGLAAMEGMALGVPVVATRTGGLEEIVEDGVSGLLVPIADDQAIAEAVARLIDRPDLAHRLRTHGCDRARERFGAQRMTDEYLRMYEELHAGSSLPS
jgi:glycosyltransferase involved in cell wall biosynthesis